MERIQRTIEPKNRMSYNQWCKKFKVGSRCEKKQTRNYFEDGEYDFEKFIKLIKNYGKEKTESNFWGKISKALFILPKRKMQKTWYKTIPA